MESKIDGLVNQIYQEGIEKAKREAETILATARGEAEELLSAARVEADSLQKKAREESEAIKRNTTAELRLASDQAIAQLRSRLQDVLLSGALGKKVEQALLDTDFLKRLILELTRSWAGGASLTLPEASQKELGERLAATLAQEVNGLEATFSPQLQAGFTVARRGDSFLVDFSDEALLQFFQSFLKSRTVELLFGRRS